MVEFAVVGRCQFGNVNLALTEKSYLPKFTSNTQDSMERQHNEEHACVEKQGFYYKRRFNVLAMEAIMSVSSSASLSLAFPPLQCSS